MQGTQSQSLRIPHNLYERVRMKSISRAVHKCTVSPYKHSICTVHSATCTHRQKARWVVRCVMGTGRNNRVIPLRSPYSACGGTTHADHGCISQEYMYCREARVTHLPSIRSAQTRNSRLCSGYLHLRAFNYLLKVVLRTFQ